MGGANDGGVANQELARYIVEIPALMRAFVVVGEHLLALAHEDDLETAGCGRNADRQRPRIGDFLHAAKHLRGAHADFRHLREPDMAPRITVLCLDGMYRVVRSE